MSLPDFPAPPVRRADGYGPNATINQKRCSQLAADFFKDSVKRVREYHKRWVVVVE
jgi:protein-serine/threonine kinase